MLSKHCPCLACDDPDTVRMIQPTSLRPAFPLRLRRNQLLLPRKASLLATLRTSLGVLSAIGERGAYPSLVGHGRLEALVRLGEDPKAVLHQLHFGGAVSPLKAKGVLRVANCTSI